jgi:signal transduction histidine kinase/ligand-binding sensor domain-containing protein
MRTINGVPYILANSNDGLVFLNSVTGKYSVIKHDPRNPHSILSNNVNDVFYDNTGTIWLATLQGLCKSEKMLPGLKTVRIGLLKNENEDLENYGSEIKVIRQDPRNSTIWIGTASRGLWQYDWGKDSVIKQIPILNGQHQPGEISELYIDKSGRLWMGTSAGAAVYEPGTEQLNFISQKNAGKDRFAKNEVTSNFMEDSQNNIWVGTSNGVSIYDLHLQFVKNIIEEWDDPAKIKSHYIYALHPKNEHQVWIISRMLKLYDLDSGSFVSEISKNQNKITIPSFFEVTDDAKGNFYFTGFSGIYVWQKQSDSFYVPHFNSLINKNFSETFVDNRNRLWVASLGAGLLKINPGTDAITQFTAKNGLSTNMMNHLLWSQRKGPVFIITKDGFQYFYPDSVITDIQSAPLLITGINILEKPLKANYQLFSDSSVRISYRQNVISFEFSLLDYNYTEDISYQYKLDGFDKDWINAGNHRLATYTNLDAGKYVFRVRAKNHDGIDAGQAIVKLRVVPPFWKTGWFIALGILIVLLLLCRWYMHQQQKYRSEKILNSFTASLYGQTTIEDMAWDIARNCVSKLGFVDCIVYILDEEKNVLVQKAACGPKNPVQREILNPIEISLGKGIVGSVAQSGVAEIIHDTSVDQRYIVDDMRRFSEISVPMVTDGTVFGIIDSEHPEKNFFTRQHLYLLRKIAEVCSLRISKYIMEDRLRSKIARDLHDEMGSTLTSINIISKVTLQQVDGNVLMKTNLQKIKDHSSQMMESMSDIVWAINPANDTLEKIILRMKEHAAEMLEPAKINLHFSEGGALDNIKLNLAQRKDLYLIFKEAINNAVKYSEATEIHIHLGHENNNMKMQIKDNGKGFEAEKTYSGNGVRNMHSRAVQMKALLEIQSSPRAGTTILLQLPIA